MPSDSLIIYDLIIKSWTLTLLACFGCGCIGYAIARTVDRFNP